VKECILVPRNAFINALALPVQGFFIEPPNNRGGEKKLLMDNGCWDEIAQQTGSFIFDTVENSISGVRWQVSSREDVTKSCGIS
jgi:hypothetical protein